MSRVSAILMGGLGNQIFQIAHAIAQGTRYNKEVVFVPNSWTQMQGNQTQKYINNIFRKLNFIQTIEGFQIVNEGNWEYSEKHPTDKDTAFYGYYQSSKNFYGFHNKIKDLFSPSEDDIDNLTKKYPKILEKNSVSIHIRRGDYLKHTDIHPVVSMNYLQKSLTTIGEYSNIFLFCDDKKWAKENIKWKDVIFVDEQDYLEMWLMSLCDNNIISNSTFSWWGSFLNKNPNKKIIAPSIWFGPKGPKNYKDIYELYWTIIDVKYENGWLN